MVNPVNPIQEEQAKPTESIDLGVKPAITQTGPIAGPMEDTNVDLGMNPMNKSIQNLRDIRAGGYLANNNRMNPTLSASGTPLGAEPVEPLTLAKPKPLEISTTTKSASGTPLGAEPIEPLTLAKPEPGVMHTQQVDPETGELVDVTGNDKLKKQFAESRANMEALGKNFTGNPMLDRALILISKMMDPNNSDPIFEQQFNNFLNVKGPENQAAMDAMTLRLKQQGKDGTGAGNALLDDLAISQNVERSQILGKLNAESMQRLIDMNKYGATLQLSINQEKRTQETFDRNNAFEDADVATEAGDFGKLQEIFNSIPSLAGIDVSKLEKMDGLERADAMATIFAEYGQDDAAIAAMKEAFPGFNEEAYRRSSGADQDIFDSRWESAMNQSTAEGRKAAMVQLARDLPGMFGFPDDPDAAAASVEGWDFNNLEASSKKMSDATEVFRTLGGYTSPDIGVIQSTAKSYYSDTSDKDLEVEYQIAVNDLPDDLSDQIYEILAEHGINSADDIDTRAEKELFLGTKKVVKAREDIETPVMAMFNQLMQNAPEEMQEWFTDPKLSEITKSWLFNLNRGGGLVKGEDGIWTIPDSTITAPYDEGSPAQSHIFSFPMTYDASGNLDVAGYKGGEPLFDENNKAVITDPTQAVNNDNMGKKYRQWRADNPDQNISMEEWYFGTKGANVEYDTDNIQEAVNAGVTDIGIPEKPVADVVDLAGKLLAGTITNDELRQLAEDSPQDFSPTSIANLPFDVDAYKVFTADNARGKVMIGDEIYEMPEAPETFGGETAIKLTSESGTEFYVDNEGRYFYNTPGIVANSSKGHKIVDAANSLENLHKTTAITDSAGNALDITKEPQEIIIPFIDLFKRASDESVTLRGSAPNSPKFGVIYEALKDVIANGFEASDTSATTFANYFKINHDGSINFKGTNVSFTMNPDGSLEVV